MKKKRSSKEVAIAKIESFFAKSEVAEFDLNEIGNKFVLDEGGLFDTEVEKIDCEGVHTDGHGFKYFFDLDVSDLRYIVGTVLPELKEVEPELVKQKTIDKVIEQIKQDIKDGDVEALDELLKFIPIQNLIAYLPEGVNIKK